MTRWPPAGSRPRARASVASRGGSARVGAPVSAASASAWAWARAPVTAIMARSPPAGRSTVGAPAEATARPTRPPSAATRQPSSARASAAATERRALRVPNSIAGRKSASSTTARSRSSWWVRTCSCPVRAVALRSMNRRSSPSDQSRTSSGSEPRPRRRVTMPPGRPASVRVAGAEPRRARWRRPIRASPERWMPCPARSRPVPWAGRAAPAVGPSSPAAAGGDLRRACPNPNTVRAPAPAAPARRRGRAPSGPRRPPARSGRCGGRGRRGPAPRRPRA